MSRAMVEQTTCDLCGYGGAYTEPADFTRVGSVDLCRWCSAPNTGPGTMTCGRHVITIRDESWSCSCGDVFTKALAPLRISPVVLAAVPSILHATARIHSES